MYIKDNQQGPFVENRTILSLCSPVTSRMRRIKCACHSVPPHLESCQRLTAKQRMPSRLLHKHERSSEIWPVCFGSNVSHLSWLCLSCLLQQHWPCLRHTDAHPPGPFAHVSPPWWKPFWFHGVTKSQRQAFIVQFVTSTWLSLCHCWWRSICLPSKKKKRKKKGSKDVPSSVPMEKTENTISLMIMCGNLQGHDRCSTGLEVGGINSNRRRHL